MVDSLVFDRCSHLWGGVASLPVVEDFEVFEDCVGQLDSGAPPPPVQQLDLHASPERFHHGVIEAVPDGHRWRNEAGLVGPVTERPGGELVWVPWSECMTVPECDWRLLIAMPSAEVTRPEVAEWSMDQPTTRRLNTSRTTAQ